MNKAIALVASSFLILLLASTTVFATDYTVGDASGWTLGVDYTKWVAGKQFKVGDTLTFKYSPNFHQLDEVSESDFNSCNPSKPIRNHRDGNTKITLSKAGRFFFFCPIGNHCSRSMKLAVTVRA
ncbi:uclacyanin-3-like [Arachis duranensis]|uniref:Uclacyanin-3-like n=1 Tax=Arachis duranensis TaxID=130453 RepID=A0A6P5MSH2_ARADU|nr:uclacyanin-3-like [Arachis duranensis]